MRRSTPTPVVITVALGIAAAPLLMIYAFLFLVHGLVVPVYPPDVGSSRAVEALWGTAALGFAALLVVGAYRLLQRRGRTLHLIAQLAVFAGCMALLLDPAAGGRVVPILLGLASFAATLAALVAASWNWVRPRQGHHEQGHHEQ